MEQWSERWRGTLYGLTRKRMLIAEGRVLGVTVKRSLISHPQVAPRISQAGWFGKVSVVGNYNGWLMYENTNRHQATARQYEEAIMQMTRKTVCK